LFEVFSTNFDEFQRLEQSVSILTLAPGFLQTLRFANLAIFSTMEFCRGWKRFLIFDEPVGKSIKIKKI
jgi:hypothetical protein